MSIFTGDTFAAMGSIASAGTVVFNSGCALARSAAGIYTCTLDRELDSAECIVLVTCRAATFACPVVVHTSDAVKTINVFDAAGAALDAGIDVLVLKKPSGG